MNSHAHRLAQAYGGSLARFAMRTHESRSAASASVRADHPALDEARTIFPSTVIPSAQAPRLLVSGVNQAKIGGRVQKGPWAGLPIYCLTLEERATCPRSCAQWATCYGNAMPLARRHAADRDLMPRLAREVAEVVPAAIRLHVLGDFFSVEYAAFWHGLLRRHRGLHLFGFTAWPCTSPIGAAIESMNIDRWQQCAIRFSVPLDAAPAPMQASVAWAGEALPPDAIACPAQTGATAACATCGLCWAGAADGRRIVFTGHGIVRRRAKRVAA